MTRRIAAALVVSAIALVLSSPAVNAERPDSNTSTVGVGPMASGGEVTQGAAGYDSSGYQASTASRADQSTKPATVSGGGDYTYRPLPNNQVPVPAPIVVTNAAGLHSVALAEYVLFVMLYFARRWPEMVAEQRAHHWERCAIDTLEGKPQRPTASSARRKPSPPIRPSCSWPSRRAPSSPGQISS